MNQLAVLTKRKGLSKLLVDIWRDYDLYLMLLPGLAGFIIFGYGPMYGLVIAFKDFNLVRGLAESSWVGFKWFNDFYNDPYFFRLIRNTLLLGTYNLMWGFPMPIILALLLNEIRIIWFKRLVQSVSFLPYFIAVITVVSIMWMLFRSDGIVNRILEPFIDRYVGFLTEPAWFRTMYIGSDIWQYTGYFATIYLAALTAIDPVLYEAAIMDGANRWQRMWHITLPGILPTITILFILSVGMIVSVGFERVFLLYSPATYETADVLPTYVYRRGIMGYNYSYAAAVGLIDSIAATIMVLSANTIVRRLGRKGESTATIW
jgi:putative aldouronate transport system permease protein